MRLTEPGGAADSGSGRLSRSGLSRTGAGRGGVAVPKDARQQLDRDQQRDSRPAGDDPADGAVVGGELAQVNRSLCRLLLGAAWKT
jgi:hypothetical protein